MKSNHSFGFADFQNIFTVQKSILLLIHLFSFSSQALQFGSFPGVPYFFNYTQGASWCEPSFECDIMTFLCEEVNFGQECNLTIFESLEQRITALENNEVDIVISRFSVTPSRAEKVEFLSPYYYSSGAQLFTHPEDKSAFPSFESLLSYPVCMELGYFVGDVLINEYGFIHFPSDKPSFLGLIEEGYCVAAITDSTFILDGLVPSDKQPVYEVPYAVAISKTPERENFEVIVEEALLQLFTRDFGENSLIEQLEEKYLISQGLQKSLKLGELSQAINANFGLQIDNNQIWDSANIVEVDSLLDKYQTIFPGSDDTCLQALDDAYDSYINGTSIDTVPLFYQDRVVYTFIMNMTLDQNQIVSWSYVQHPFFEVSEQICERNPQCSTGLLQLNNQLAIEENRVDGAIWIAIIPFDSQQVLEDDEMMLEATRVMKTLYYLTLEGRREDVGRTFIIACGAGEVRDW
eukprot:TRINITY_DN9419_c0_g1_i9.p1 TRINITY_DN9419_c0_g1~~TRINITY_DN9419_c0_g1_i9.p1  ORF type:complete len:479 (+),score=33.88 TRINITY_DN9419_c0_g1_i9:51-1439(+)